MNSRSEFRRGAAPLIGAIVGAGCGLSSISFYTHGVFVPVLADDLGWSRSDIQLAVSIMILMAVVTAPAVGALIDRFGPRRVALTSIPLYGLTLASLSLAGQSLPMYYAGWAAMSVLAAGTLPITWTRVVTAWFDRSRGIALGLTLAGTGIAATLAPGFVAWLSSEYGWRAAYVLLAVAITGISLPAVYLLFHDLPTADRAAAQQRLLSGVTLRRAFGQARFWVMMTGLLLVAACISGLITNLVPLLVDRGLDIASAGRFAGLIGISVIAGRIVTGFLLDRIWAPLVAAVFLGAPALAAWLLMQSGSGSAAIAVAAVVVGFAAGAELDLFAYLAGRYFGLRHYGAIYGALYVAFSLGAGLAPWLFAVGHDQFGSYLPALRAVIGLSLVGGAMMLLLGRYPDFD